MSGGGDRWFKSTHSYSHSTAHGHSTRSQHTVTAPHLLAVVEKDVLGLHVAVDHPHPVDVVPFRKRRKKKKEKKREKKTAACTKKEMHRHAE